MISEFPTPVGYGEAAVVDAPKRTLPTT